VAPFVSPIKYEGVVKISSSGVVQVCFPIWLLQMKVLLSHLKFKVSTRLSDMQLTIIFTTLYYPAIKNRQALL